MAEPAATTRTALFKGRDYITTEEWTTAEIETLLAVSADLKRKFKGGLPHRHLPDKTIFLMFFDKSTRTRNSFEAGITQLGGHAHFLTADVMQVSHGESPKDTGVILSRYATPSPSATTSSPARATPTCARWRAGPTCRSSTCSATWTIPARRWPTS